MIASRVPMAWVFLATMCAPAGTLADEVNVPLAISGDWMAMAHKTDMISAPDVCLLLNRKGLAFRMDASSALLRMMNDAWSLPPDVTGEIKVAVGQWSRSLMIVDNTDKMVSATLGPTELIDIFAAMDKAPAMTVKAGNAPITTISLAGSTKATNAFRTCAGIKSNAETPGSNPFK